MSKLEDGQTAFVNPSEMEVIRGTDEKELTDELLEIELKKLTLKPGSRILDFGCGTGTLIRQHLIPFAEKVDGYIVGTDISKTLIDFATENSAHPRVTYFCADAENTTLEENPFDLITCTFVVDYIPNAEKVLPRFYKFLKPGGKLWLMTTGDKKLYEYFKALKQDETFGPFSKGLPEPEWALEDKEDACEEFYRKYLSHSGFKILEMNIHPSIGIEYPTIDGYVDFFMWVSMGATSTPKSMESKLREFCTSYVKKWVTETPTGVKLEWAIFNFLAEK